MSSSSSNRGHHQTRLFASRPRKHHPWIRLEGEATTSSNTTTITTAVNPPQHRVPTARRSSSKMHLSVDTSFSNKSNTNPSSALHHHHHHHHPEEPGAIVKRRSPSSSSSNSNSSNNVSPRGSASVNNNNNNQNNPNNNNNMGTTFQQYRQQRSVRKHPWRTDVRSSKNNNKRGTKSWRHLVKSAAPWDEVPTIIEEEEEEEWIARTSSKDSETSQSCALSVTGDAGAASSVVREVNRPLPAATPNTTDALLLQDLQERLTKVYQGDHYIVQGTGTGRGKRVVPLRSEREDAVRQQLVKALQDRLQNYYTGHLVSWEGYGKQGAGEGKSGESLEQDEGSDEGSAVSVDESVVSVQSMIVAATILHSQRDVIAASPQQQQQQQRPPLEDDEWTEYTLESRATARPVRKNTEESGEWEEYTVYDEEGVVPQTTSRNDDHEEEEWDEETIATEAFPQSQQIQILHQTSRAPDEEEESVWDEYTVETSAFEARQVVTPCVAHEQEWDEYTVETIADALLSLPHALQAHQHPQPTGQELPLERQDSADTTKSPSSIADTVKDIVRDSNSRLAHQHLDGFDGADETVSYVDEIIEEDYDDDHWDDYTVETVADAFASLPRSLQLEFVRASTRNMHPEQDDEEEEVVEDEDDASSECSSQPPPEGAFEEPQTDAQESQAGDEWTEVTCEETIHDIPGILAATGQPPNKTDRKPSDPTLSSTDSESETWHDARSSGSGDPPCVQEVGSSSSSGAGSNRSTMSARRRMRSPPTNLNQILKEDIFSQNLSVVEGALRSLAQKADDDLEYRAHIVHSGGILAVVRAMQQNVYNAGVQILACETLQKIATDKENRVAIGEVGGVEAVVGAMAEHMADEDTAQATCVALWVLTSQCSQNQLSIETAAIDVIVSCMRRYAKNPTIQEKAFQTLANLCLEHEEKLVALSQMGGFVVMSTALVLHWENTTVKNEAISTLSLLFGRLAVSQTA